jgi:S1-C subfamily serine protease
MKIDRDVLKSSLIITLMAIASIGIVIAANAQLPELPPLPPLIQEAEDSQLPKPLQEGNLSFALDSQLSQLQQEGNLSFAQVYRDYVNSVVGIILPTSVSFNPNPVFDGTGFVYAKEGRILYVITPAHVISGYEAEKVNVAFPDGSTYEASVQGSDPRTDIAVLELKHNATEERSVEPIRLGNSSAVVVGEEVLAVGNPFLAGGQTLPNLATRGIVGAAGVEAFGAAGNSIIGAIVTDAPGAGGSSGSPVFNSRGEVLGMVTSGDEVNNVVLMPFPLTF